MAEFKDKPNVVVVETTPNSAHIFRGPMNLGNLHGINRARIFSNVVLPAIEAIRRRESEAKISDDPESTVVIDSDFRNALSPHLTWDWVGNSQFKNIVFVQDPHNAEHPREHPAYDHLEPSYSSRAVEAMNIGRLFLDKVVPRAFFSTYGQAGVFDLSPDQFRLLAILGSKSPGGFVDTTSIISVFESEFEPTEIGKTEHPELYIAELASSLTYDYRFGDALRTRSFGPHIVGYRLRLNTEIAES